MIEISADFLVEVINCYYLVMNWKLYVFEILQ